MSEKKREYDAWKQNDHKHGKNQEDPNFIKRAEDGIDDFQSEKILFDDFGNAEIIVVFFRGVDERLVVRKVRLNFIFAHGIQFIGHGR